MSHRTLYAVFFNKRKSRSEMPEDQITGQGIFVSDWDRHNRPGSIVALGQFYAQGQAEAARNLVRETAGQGYTASVNAPAVWQNADWTRLIAALNKDRQWAIKELFERLNPMLEPGIAIAVVPPHRAYQAFWPVRALARRLASNSRVDATGCLVRHTTIRRILFGGPSARALHRQTIEVEDADLIAGRRVLLLDDITKSGFSLSACRELLLDAGAAQVQAVALARVILPRPEG